MPDDRALVTAAQAGNRAALDTLLRRHYDRVHAICRRVIGSARDADDAAQEALISIVRGLPSFDGRAAFTTWLYRVATNAALDEVRKRSRRPALQMVNDDGTAREEADLMAHRTIEAVGDRLDIDAGMIALPEEFRAAVVLRDVCDLDYGEIADVLEIPVGTVKSRIARGRVLLAKALRPGAPRDSGSGGRDRADPAGGNRREASDRPSTTSPSQPGPDTP